jgi:hypothetical protein
VEENAKEGCAKRDLGKRTHWNKGETMCIMRTLDVLCVILLFKKKSI